MAAPLEGLVAAQVGGGQALGTFGQIEGVAVPVQHGGKGAVERGQHGGCAFGGELQGLPADFLGGAGVDARAERTGHELCTEADAQRGAIGLQAGAQQVQFVVEEGVEGFLVGADGPAEHDEQIGRESIQTREGVDACIEILHGVAAGAQQGGEGSQILEGNVADGDGVFHGRAAGRQNRRRGPFRQAQTLSETKPA